jgi:ABC-type Fe3+ transport system permease subunit
LRSVCWLVALVWRRWNGGNAVQRHHDAGRRFERMEPVRLRGRAAAGAFAVCGLPVFFGFLLPAAILMSLASGASQALPPSATLDSCKIR